jgi:hypothetical protein
VEWVFLIGQGLRRLANARTEDELMNAARATNAAMRETVQAWDRELEQLVAKKGE